MERQQHQQDVASLKKEVLQLQQQLAKSTVEITELKTVNASLREAAAALEV